MKELLKVKGVSELKRDFYELVIKDTETDEVDSIILCNPNIKDYCNKNNISLTTYEYSQAAYGWGELMGVIEKYINEDDRKYKANAIE